MSRHPENTREGRVELSLRVLNAMPHRVLVEEMRWRLECEWKEDDSLFTEDYERIQRWEDANE